jgi:hypothetical protein
MHLKDFLKLKNPKNSLFWANTGIYKKTKKTQKTTGLVFLKKKRVFNQPCFQACTDVQGSESTSEELQCIAAWKEGSKKYLVAELNREHMYSDESKFKCFVYERVGGKGEEKAGIRMAQSESATCSGLWSAQEGFRTFDMETGGARKTYCRN